MAKAKFCVLVLVVVSTRTFAVTNSDFGKTAEILFNLTNYAIESRQISNPCLSQENRYKYLSCIQKLYSNHYGLASHSPSNYYHIKKPYLNYQPRPLQNQHSIMEVLGSIAKNDELRCVPRLLCEVMSDTLSKGRQNFPLPNLPFNVESIVGLLSAIDIGGGSPIPTFAKAAFLGYISKGNSDSCLDAYPKCPRDADRLVKYLNNHNGGFFRFFSGVNPQINHNNYGFNRYPQNLYFQRYPYNQRYAEQRIQNKPVQYTNNAVTFSSDNYLIKGSKSLTFPSDDSDGSSNEFSLRKPKELPFSISHYYSDGLDLQRPLPNHKATPMIFPDRTGTGELRLDADELNENYKQSYYNPQNNNPINFNSLATNEDYEVAPEGVAHHYVNKATISFPDF